MVSKNNYFHACNQAFNTSRLETETSHGTITDKNTTATFTDFKKDCKHKRED